VTRDSDHEVEAAAKALRESQLLTRRRADLDALVKRLSARLDEARADVSEQDEDMERLERLTFTRVMASLRQVRDSTLAAERAEAQAARYRAQEVRVRLTAAMRERAVVGERLERLSDAAKRYEMALERREQALRDGDDPRGRRLLVIASERGLLLAEHRDLVDAQRAAARAARALETTATLLSGAAGWSAVDTFLRGGIISGSIKYSRLDEAARTAARADRCLTTLRVDLEDVPSVEPVVLDLVPDGFTRVTDIWLDNAFTDFAVREQIKKAQQAVGRSRGQVGAVLRALSGRLQEVRGLLDELEGQRRALLTGRWPG
jgi:hypothetical protein